MAALSLALVWVCYRLLGRKVLNRIAPASLGPSSLASTMGVALQLRLSRCAQPSAARLHDFLWYRPLRTFLVRVVLMGHRLHGGAIYVGRAGARASCTGAVGAGQPSNKVLRL